MSKECFGMRELSTPSLFDPPAARPPAVEPETPSREEWRSEKLAKDFILWCFSFGADFRNSPDIINLRTWQQKTRFKLKEAEENEVLIESRRLNLKKIEQMMKKADTSVLAAASESAAMPD